MATLNDRAAEAMKRVGFHACTDITGFGLIGHSHNIARASRVTLRFEASQLPLFDGELARLWIEPQPGEWQTLGLPVTQMNLGGVISPGLAISMEALFQHASKLPRVELVRPRSVIGNLHAHAEALLECLSR